MIIPWHKLKGRSFTMKDLESVAERSQDLEEYVMCFFGHEYDRFSNLDEYDAPF